MNFISVYKHQYICMLLALITGACGTLAFSPYNFWPMAFVSLSGLLIVTAFNHNICQVIYLGFTWGVGLFGTGVSWIYVSIAQFSELPVLINILLVVLLITYLAIYPTLFVTLLVRLWSCGGLWQLVFGAPGLWIIVEFLRGWVLTGFPWLEFGYSQIDSPLKGIAPIAGVHGITFLLMMISGLIVFTLTNMQLTSVLCTLSLLLLPWTLCSIQWYQPEIKRGINVVLVQGNINQSIKWKTSQIYSTLNVYLQHTLPFIGKAQVIIWPESAIPDNEITQSNFLICLDKKLRESHTSLITGIIDARSTSHGYKYYNSLIVLGQSIPYCYYTVHRYDKHHLVPLGETIPLQNLLHSLISFFNLPMSSLSSGPYIQPQLHVAGIKFTTTICYEIILGDQVRDNFHSDTDFLLTISNNAWFGKSIGPWQHFQMARMRSLELGRPLLHSTNNGITAIINADGTPKAQLSQFTREVLNVNVIPTRGITPYARIGSWITWIITMLVSFIALIFDHKNDGNHS